MTLINTTDCTTLKGHDSYFISIPPKANGIRRFNQEIWEIVDAFEVAYKANTIHRINGKLRGYLYWGRTSDADGQPRVLISFPPIPKKTKQEVISHLKNLMMMVVTRYDAPY